MASILEHKDGYRAHVCVHGFRRSKTFKTRASAKEWADAFEALGEAIVSGEDVAGLSEVVDELEFAGEMPRGGPAVIVEEKTLPELGLPDVSEIVASSAPIAGSFCGVYFLIKGSEVVYVGQSTNVMGRLTGHLRGKDFDRFAFLNCPKSQLLDIESRYIAALKPKHNTYHPALVIKPGTANLKKVLPVLLKRRERGGIEKKNREKVEG